MKISRRALTATGAALAVAAAFASLPARADDMSDAKGVVDKATATVNAFAADKDYVALPQLLKKAKGVLVYPQIIEGGFIIGGSGGTGVLLVRDEKTGAFSNPAFYGMGGVSLGFLAGGAAAETMVVVNTQKAMDSLLSTKVKLGGDASVAVGPKGAGAASTFTEDFVSYSKSKGAYANMSLSGQVIASRDSLNNAYYGKPVTPVDILVKKNVSNAGAAPLEAALKAMTK
ncbi:MAG: lipid-binding SYLF domain-containing protein [Piscinibacter sp.]|nr:lipid-binding SYLF domain-containing protein [Piscinibacter sp.]